MPAPSSTSPSRAELGSLASTQLATGAERWSRALGEKSAVLVDAKRVFYGIDGTLVVAEAATGTEIARMKEAKR